LFANVLPAPVAERPRTALKVRHASLPDCKAASQEHDLNFLGNSVPDTITRVFEGYAVRAGRGGAIRSAVRHRGELTLRTASPGRRGVVGR